MGMKILIEMFFFSLKKDNRTRGCDVILVKDQCKLDINQEVLVLTEDSK